MSNQQQEQIKSNVAADDLEKALDEREQTKPRTIQTQTTIADIINTDFVDVNYTNSKSVKDYIENKEFIFYRALSLIFLTPIVSSFFVNTTSYNTFPVVLIIGALGSAISLLCWSGSLNSDSNRTKYNKPKLNQNFLKNLYLNDADFSLINKSYQKTLDSKPRNLIIGILIICLSILPVIMLANTTNELLSFFLMTFILIIGIAVIIKIFYNLKYLKDLLDADEKNHETKTNS